MPFSYPRYANLVNERTHQRMRSIDDAMACMRNGDDSSATEICWELIEKNDSRVKAYNILANLASKLGNQEQAIKHHKSAIQIQPLDTQANLELARIYARASKWEEAVFHSSNAVSHTDALEILCQSLLLLCISLLNISRTEDAVETARKLRSALLSPGITDRIKPGFLKAASPVLAVLLEDDLFASRFFQLQSRIISPDLNGVVAEIANTSQWCLANDAEFKPVEPSRNISFDCGSEGIDRWAYETQETFIAKIPGGQLVPGWDFVIAPDGTVLADSGYIPVSATGGAMFHYFDATISDSKMIRPNSRKSVYIDRDVVFLSCPWGFHPTHWICDFLTRLRIRDFVKRDDLAFAVPQLLPDRNRDFLKYFNVSEGDLIECAENTLYSFRNLYIFQPGTSDFPSPENVHYLYNHLAGNYGAGKIKPGARFFLTRESAGTRLVENSEEFEKLLAKYQFKSIDLGVLSIDEQVSALSSAEILLGAFGSNLIGFYYAPIGCHVIELNPDIALSQLFGMSCHLIKHQHEFVACKASHPETLPESRANLAYNVIVDCDKLDRRLQQKLNR